MSGDMQERVHKLKAAIEGIRGYLDLDDKRKRIAELTEKSLAPDFWNDNENAQAVSKERAQLESEVDSFQRLERETGDLADLLDLAEGEGDDAVLADLAAQLEALESRHEDMEMRRMLGGPADKLNAFAQFSPGAGGVDSADWANMLLRMVTRWAERMGYKVELVDLQENDEAGIKSAMINVIGEYAYGYLKAERGIHRLVRISPFDAAARRHTAFAAIDVIPEVSEEIKIEIKDEDLRVDTFRAGGKGGQHVNKTDSAVRLTHLPTGIVVQCQNERSQHKNKSQAMKVLKARLYEREMEERRKETEQRNAEKKEIAWGSQIRSYVLAPYRMVKDHRTGFEKGDVDSVLDGGLDPFIRAYLLATAGG
ncbi:MAG: peptide chain release factor 2 [Deltaproteobacteria bacterium]|nr:peptide chain release factor 2 [Deltaproteobacteria bacterium]